MNWSTLECLKADLTPFWSTARTGRCGKSLDKCLYVTLWKLCNSRVTFRQLSDRFGIANGAAHYLFKKTIKVLCELKSEIKWPSVEQQQTIMTKFENSRENPFPFVIGCLDGTHFNIPTPSEDAISYYDRKRKHSVQMQAICDSQFRFLDVFIGYPGSCHDANVWRSSPVFNGITSGQLQLAPGAIILGDSAYPISKSVMAPYRDNGHLTREEKKFNTRLSSTRVFIEQAFGILKKKFKILNHIDISSLKGISDVILACAILHNFILRKDNPLEHIDEMAPQQHGNIETASELETLQDSPLWSAETDDENGVDRRNYSKTLFSS
ncbi:uncharacterized protein LOC129248028 [Anastrepha obliqua]|uniref:uncharacterized protein LOC129248028 n=1 Tax=Anastrepha obliqua TaxID=95512 RepID=UPI0024097CCE|nr:uncharacterized protein LOC129248028 [Anastrepha obliqua]